MLISLSVVILVICFWAWAEEISSVSAVSGISGYWSQIFKSYSFWIFLVNQ